MARSRSILWTALGTVLLTLTACGNLESIHRTTGSLNDGYKIAFIDAKQRGIVVTRKLETKVTNTAGYNSTTSDFVQFCAEPSPDALASVAASLSGSLTGSSAASQQLAAQVAASLSGTATNIGLRTQSIQLMRDALYRLCEAGANGHINEFQMRTLHMRYQNMIIGLLAIEQLTGVVRGPNATTTSEANAQVAGQALELSRELAALGEEETTLQQSIPEIEESVATLKSELDVAEKDRDAKSAGLKATPPTATQKELDESEAKVVEQKKSLAADESKLGTAQKRLADVEKSMSALRRELAVARSVSAETESNSTNETPAIPNRMMDEETTQIISEQVQKIVKQVVEQDNTIETCSELLYRFMVGEFRSDDDQQTRLFLEFCSRELEAKRDEAQQVLNKFFETPMGHLVSEFSDPRKTRVTLNKLPSKKPESVMMTDAEYHTLYSKVRTPEAILKPSTYQAIITSLIRDSKTSTREEKVTSLLEFLNQQASK